MTLPDFSQRFLFVRHDVRGVRVRLEQSFQEIISKQAYPDTVKTLLGEITAAAVLMSSSLKENGSLILQARGSEPLSILMAECKDKRYVRAIAEYAMENLPDLEQSGLNLQQLIGDAQLTITLSPEKGSRYQGIVPLASAELNHCLEDYFKMSEQLDTMIVLHADNAHAVGLMLQKLPQSTQPEDSDDWDRLCHLARTVKPEELQQLDTQTLLNRLFNEDDIQLFDEDSISFACSCSQERCLGAIQSLGKEEAFHILEQQGHIDMDCHFCHQHYHFDEAEVRAIFGEQPLH